MSSRRTQVSIIVAATLSALACSDDGRDLGTHDDEGREYAARDTGAMPTPTDQSSTERDIDLTQRIRRGITSVERMSVQARNVKVISRDGFVTLRGPVESVQEKATIELLAKNAGAAGIDNQLEVDSDRED